ncbi:leucine-rich repeat domain-containing protein [Algibacter pacificus]|uniref:leucine-rich repeat domain-containing protein n=1 Tax=Algibacter pacificus TaxID=2599389 RepID=UPI0011CB8401|nr:leucine-rich repeat domain-containing protein [Algibacter pacificus]
MKIKLLFFITLFSISISQAQTTFNDGLYEYTVLSGTDVSIKALSTAFISGTLNIPGTVVNGGIMYNVTTIAKFGFANNSNITEITIPVGVTTILSGAFGNCENLFEVTIPNGVTTIEKDAFNLCMKIKDLVIPNTVTYIGENAFANLDSLETVTVSWPVPLVLATDVFGESKWTGNIELIVLNGTHDAYSNAPIWEDFNPLILGKSTFNITKAVQIYPNPVKDVLAMELNQGIQFKQARLFNNLGQLIQQSENLSTNISTLKSGLYILEIETNKGKLIKKIVKQ